MKNHFFGPSRFSYFFFSPVFCLSSCSPFIFCSFLHFLIFFNVFHFFIFFSRKKFLLFFFLVFLSNIFFLLALVSEFNCFLRCRCSMEMWCPDDIGRDSWDSVGPNAWGRACFDSWVEAPRLSKRSLSRLSYCCCFVLFCLFCLFVVTSKVCVHNPHDLFGITLKAAAQHLG